MGNAGRVLMIPKGDYNAATTYEMLDCVYYNGRSYVCKQTSTGNLPTNTTYWQVMTPDSSAEIQALTNYVTDTGVKNIMPVSLASLKSFNTNGSWNGNVYTLGGITLTVATDANGNVTRITANGSDADTLYFYIARDVSLKSGTYTLNGCPSGGSTSKYIIYKTNLSELGEWVDIGNGKNLTLASDTTGIHFAIRITGNVSVSNITFKPMIRLASITDPTYQPYAKTNVELTADVAEIIGNYVLKGSGSVTANKDNTKTRGELLVEALNALNTVITGLSNNEAILINAIDSHGVTFSVEAPKTLLTNANPLSAIHGSVTQNIDGTRVDVTALKATTTTGYYTFVEMSSNGINFADRSSSAETSADTVIKYFIFEKIS